MNDRHDPQIICELRDANVGLHSYLVLDSIGPKGACGGIRMKDDLTLEEVMALARAMTLKYRFIGLIPVGGAKAGIVTPPHLTIEQRQEILKAFGRQAAPLLRNRIYNPWTDMNTGPLELNQILAGAGLPPRKWADSGYYTALTITAALKALCEVRGVAMSNLSASVEGFGNVGGHVVREFHELGVRIVGVSTTEGAVYDPRGLDVPSLLKLRLTYAARAVHFAPGTVLPRESLLELPADVLVPAAAAWTINAGNAARIKSPIIVPAANIPLTQDAKDILTRRGITVLPDFVCNSGGALGSYLEGCGLKPLQIRQVILRDFKRAVRHLISHGELDEPPESLASFLPVFQTRRRRTFSSRAKKAIARLFSRPTSGCTVTDQRFS